ELFDNAAHRVGGFGTGNVIGVIRVGRLEPRARWRLAERGGPGALAGGEHVVIAPDRRPADRIAPDSGGCQPDLRRRAYLKLAAVRATGRIGESPLHHAAFPDRDDGPVLRVPLLIVKAAHQ